MSMKELSLNDLYLKLWKSRCQNEFMSHEEYDILEEIKRREKDDRPR